LKTPTTPSTKDRAAAWHEAGHAVAAIVLGMAFRWVSIQEEEGSLGRVYHGELTNKQVERLELAAYETGRDARIHRFIESRIIVTLAGSETAALFMGSTAEDEGAGVGNPLTQADADQLNVPKPGVIRVGEPLRPGERLLLPGGDARQALWLATQICDSEEETSAYLEWLRQRTLNLIREKTFGPAVRAVTDEL
jgi:hypothetical protein